VYATLRRHQDAIAVLKQAAELSSESNAASLDELIALYKALGRAYFSRDHVEEAILAWGKIAEIDPQNIFARIQLADLFREQELYTKAIEQHEVIIRLKKDDPYRVCLSHREIGKIHEEKGDYQKAIQSYDAAITLTTPGNWLRKDVQRRIIGVFASDGNWQGLVAYYQRKLQTAPNDPELIGLLASAYIENQQLDEGIDAYRKALELAPADTALRLELITVLRNAEKFDEAAAEYEFLSGSQPDDLGIYRELAELYLELQDENRAKTTFRRVIDRDPGNAGIHLTLADIYASHEWKDDAVAAYEKAASLAPNNLDYIQYYGEYYLRQGKRDKAVEIWNRMVVGDKAIPENYDRLARLLWTKEFRIDAIAASRNAVALAPAEYRYREALARRLMENEEYDAALSEYAKASKLAPNEFFAEQMNNQRIEIFRRQGVLPEQIEEVASAPKTFDRQKQLAKMYLKLGNITNAMESLSQAKTLKPDDVSINRRLAALYAKQRRREEAVAIYEHLAEIDSGNAREYYSDSTSSTASKKLRRGNPECKTGDYPQPQKSGGPPPSGAYRAATGKLRRSHQ
jgi:tetratricopeptide (TPR) repeat protein